MQQPVRMPQKSLVRLLSQRLAIASLLAIVLQIGLTAVRSYFDEIDLDANFVKYEARLIEAQYLAGRSSPHGGLAALPARYLGQYKGAYSFRILTPDGRVLAEHNGGLLAALSPWRFPQSETQDFWLRRLDGTAWMHIAGGVHFTRPGDDLWVEVATQGDPAGAHVSIFARELIADVWMPMIPLVVLTLGVAILTVRRSLEPLVRAADKADTLAVLDRSERLDVETLPREAASLATAINGLLDKVAELVRSQRLFLARAAHELRTPLSIMLLELERSSDPRVRKLEADVRSMSDMVDRLLTLAKLESIGTPEFSDVDVEAMAAAQVAGMSEWALQTGHRIEFDQAGPVVVRADRFAVREAIRNLIENAVKHSPPGSQVRVLVGPGPRLIVEDSGAGIEPETVQRLLEPFARGTTQGEGAGLGLAIVAQAAALNGAALNIGKSTLGGARIEIEFPAPAAKS
jgi:signal transduction histidine kinase